MFFKFNVFLANSAILIAFAADPIRAQTGHDSPSSASATTGYADEALKQADFDKLSPNLLRWILSSIEQRGEHAALEQKATGFVLIKGNWTRDQIQDKFGILVGRAAPRSGADQTHATAEFTLRQALELSTSAEVVFVSGAQTLEPRS